MGCSRERGERILRTKLAHFELLNLGAPISKSACFDFTGTRADLAIGAPFHGEGRGELSKLFGFSQRPNLDGRLAPAAGGALLINDLAGWPAVVVTSSPVSGGAAVPDRNGELPALRPGPPGEKGKDED